MKIDVVNLIVTGIATWRVSNILFDERGPFDLILQLREQLGITHDSDGDPFIWPNGSIFQCIWCLSIWVGLVLSVLPAAISRVFAVSAIAIILEKYFGARTD